MTSCKRPWPVLLLCCVLSFTSLGTPLGMGAIFTDVMDTFGVPRATASLVQSVCTGFMYGGGIFSGHVLHSWGPRVTVIAGSVLATAGCLIGFLATHIAQVIVGIGVIAGSGISLNFLTAQTLPGIVFHDMKSLAMGIMLTASAVGSAVYPLMLRHVTNHYSVRGTFLIMAAINCQMILCGALIGLYIPRKNPAIEKTAEYRVEAETEGEKELVNDKEEVVDLVVRDKDLREEDGRNRPMPAGLNQDSDLNQHDAIVASTGDMSEMANKDSLNDYCTNQSQSATLPCPHKTYQGNTNRLMPAGRRENESNPGGILLIDETRDATAKMHELPLLTKKSETQPPSANADNDAGKTTRRSCCSVHTIREALSMPLELFRDPRFLALSVVGGSSFLFYPLPWMFMTDMVKSNNLSVEDGSLFITVIFVGNLAGRSSSGFLYKLLKSRIQIMPGVTIATGGVSCLLFVFCKSYAHFVVVSFTLGLSFGFLASTFLMTLLELEGPRKFVVGTGYLIFCVGVFFLLAGPYGGLIRDLTSSYEPLYYIAVVHGLVVGAVLLFTTLRCQP